MSRPNRLLTAVASRRTISGALVGAGTVIMVLAGAGPAVSALAPPEDHGAITAEPSAARPIEMTWLSSGVVPATDDLSAQPAEPPPTDDERDDDDPGVTAPAGTEELAAAEPADDASEDLVATASADGEVTDEVAPAATVAPDDGATDDVAVPAPTGDDASPVPLDDIVSNYGCMMIEPEPGEHLGVNCIDDGWLNTDGTVYVHTTVPAAQHVRFSSSPPSGVSEDGFPDFAAFDFDFAPDYSSYEFTSKPFDIVAAKTYYIVAMAWDSEGSMAWRYGTATVPYVAHVVIDEITILNDGDEGSWNKGEIKFSLRVGEEQWSFSEDKYDDGDSFNPGADHIVADAGPTLTISATATEDDPGKCVVEYYEWNNYQDGGGCHFAKAVEEFDLTTGQPTLDVDFTSPDEHLRIRVEGRITIGLP